jgi:hypothetical protein
VAREPGFVCTPSTGTLKTVGHTSEASRSGDLLDGLLPPLRASTRVQIENDQEISYEHVFPVCAVERQIPRHKDPEKSLLRQKS